MPSYYRGWYSVSTEVLAEEFQMVKKETLLEMTFAEWLDAMVEGGDLVRNPVEWVITKDIIDLSDILGPEFNREGMSKDGIPLDLHTKLMAPGCKIGYQFRLYDDDGNHYFTGRVYDPTGEYDSEYLYEILKWGAADSGCTELLFPRMKQWNMS